MNQLRHNFTKADRLSAQITTCVEEFSAQYTALDSDETISCQIENIEQKDWQSATYDGEIYCYKVEIYSNINKLTESRADYIEKLMIALNEYEFDLSGSFVADITIKQSQYISIATLQFTIEGLIIYES